MSVIGRRIRHKVQVYGDIEAPDSSSNAVLKTLRVRSKRKQKRSEPIQHQIPPPTNPKFYVIEDIECFYFDPGSLELLFFVKWKDEPDHMKAFENLAQVRHSKTFKKYIGRLYGAMQSEIEIKNRRLKSKLKEKIDALMLEPKATIMEKIKGFDSDEFEAFQAVSVTSNPYASFHEKYEKLFFLHHFVELHENQLHQFSRKRIEIYKLENIRVSFSNKVDFSSPKDFKYVTKNRLSTGNQDTADDCERKEHTSELKFQVFRKSCCGWGIISEVKILKESKIFECLGEILSETEAAAREDKSFFFPIKLGKSIQLLDISQNQKRLQNDSQFIIDASNVGNLSRFVNHSFTPNAKFDLSAENLFLFAIRDIEEGEEITVDYTMGSINPVRNVCHC